MAFKKAIIAAESNPFTDGLNYWGTSVRRFFRKVTGRFDGGRVGASVKNASRALATTKIGGRLADVV